MRSTFASRVIGLLRASHFGPTVLVVTITFSLALSQYSAQQSARIAVAIFFGQLVVGWSNDLLDLPLDRAANRNKKPLVSGAVGIVLLKCAIPLATLLALLLSLLSPLGRAGTLVHMLGIASALLYNIKLKRTFLSPLPYIVSFAALPWAIYLSAHKSPPLWLYLDFALVSVAFHFLNVIKDLAWDIDQGVLGLPQRIGRKASLVVATILIGGALAILLVR